MSSENVYTVQHNAQLPKSEILHKYKDVFKGHWNIRQARLTVAQRTIILSWYNTHHDVLLWLYTWKLWRNSVK